MRVLLAALIGSARGLPTAAPTESLGGCPFLTSNNDYFGASRCDEASYDEEWDEASEYEHECYMHEWIASSCAELRCDPESERLWLTKRHVHDMHRENSNNWWSWRTDACMVLSPDGRFYRATTGYEATREEGWMDKGSYRDSTDVDASGLAGLNATDASVLAWGRRAYAACVEQCGGCDATGAAVDRVPAGLDAFFAAPYPAVDRPALDDAGCFSARALRGEDWPFVSTGHWVVICVMALVLATPWVLGVCASRRCCPWYGSLQRVRNEFADACPCLARSSAAASAPPGRQRSVAPEEDDAAAAAGEAPADDVVLLEPQAEDAPGPRGAGFRARGASVAGQARLVLWKIWKTKSRSPSTVLSQLVFPAAWFVVVWLLYVIMAKTFLPNHQWNKKHWNYAAKGGDMRDYEEGDILSHGLLEVYLCQFAFVPLMQAVVVAVVVEHRAKLVESMKMAGLRPLAYWAATFAAEALAVGFACAFLVACVACGGLFRRAGHAADPFGTLLALHWTYVVALAAQCFAVTTLVTSPTAAAVYALAAQLAATGAYQSLVVETTDAGKRVVLSLFEASESRQLVAALLPQFAYALVVDGFRSRRTHMCDLGAGLGAETFRSPAFECDDDKAEARAGVQLAAWAQARGAEAWSCWLSYDYSYGGGAYEASSSSSSSYAYGADASSSYSYAYAADAYAYEPLDRCERTRAPSEYPPFYARDAPFYGDGPRPAPRWTAAIYGVLVADVFLYLGLAWYLSQVVPWAAHGTPRRWYFPLLPSTYGCRREAKKDVELERLDGHDDAEDEARPEAYEPRRGATVVEVKRLRRTFGAFAAVDGVSYSVLSDFARASKGLGVVNQHNTLWEDLTCLDHLALFGAIRCADPATVVELAAATLRRVELGAHAAKLAGRLSGGMKRKLCCAVALVGDPSVVLLDEPSAGLDPVSQRNLWNLIKATMRGRSVVLTTHSMFEAEVLCDRIAIQVRGQLACLGTPDHLKRKFGSGYELVVALDAALEADFAAGVARVVAFVVGAFEGARLASTDASILTFELAAADASLARVFRAFTDEAKRDLGVAAFSLQQASMEKVFIRIVGAGGDYFEVARWSEPYDSIPDIWGPVASAVAPIFDKRADPWTFLGVAAADVPLCELEALSGYTDDGGDVAANPTQQGCACEEGSYEYDGRTFEGCTSYDWSVPWCGTTNCGICDDLVSTGCWDECEDSGTVRGKMEAYLRGRSSAVCAGRIAAFTDGAIELTAAATNALRESFPCPVGTAAAEDDEWISALTVANPFSVGADWRDDESSYDAQTLGRESSCGSLYEMQPCDSCDAALTPTCSYELCLSAAESGTREDAGDAYCSSSLDTGARANLHEGLLLFTALYAAARARP
ncbi:glutathione S-transferase [Aureococcus anophagefferens]|uniref:Glutathione S-transferase n=1 Tax=Aureococcus anophagefferens TaxID=44056 RepID=A0ABR1FG48_AURAN